MCSGRVHRWIEAETKVAHPGTWPCALGFCGV